MKHGSQLFLVLSLVTLPAAAGAQPAQPPMVMGAPETVYSDAQREKDLTASQQMVERMLAPSFSVDGQYARWKQPICPHVYGLSAAAGWFVEHRIREAAAEVGAPVDRSDACIANIGIIFTVQPQASLESVARANPLLVQGGYQKVSAKYPVQAWYATFKVDYNGSKSIDIPFDIAHPAADCFTSAAFNSAGNSMGDVMASSSSGGSISCERPNVRANESKLHTGLTAEIGAATVLVDTRAVTGMTLGELSDYLAFITLAQASQSGVCQPLTTIANLMIQGCEAGTVSHRLSHADIALLTALYQVPDSPEVLQKQRIVGAMRRSLEAQFGKE